MEDRVRPFVERIWGYHQLNHQLVEGGRHHGALQPRHDRGRTRRGVVSRGVGTAADLFRGPGRDHEAPVDRRRRRIGSRELPWPWACRKSSILIENRSTNTGENVLFTRELLAAQRARSRARSSSSRSRTWSGAAFATFSKVWPGKRIIVTSPRLSLDEYLARYSNESLSADDVIGIMVGDLQRIREYPARGFQISQDIPDDVWEAYEELVRAGYDKYPVKSPDAVSVTRHTDLYAAPARVLNSRQGRWRSEYVSC